MFKTARFSFLSIAVIVILVFSLAFLYLLQRQEIYQNIKSNNQTLVENEVKYINQISKDWTGLLSSLVKHVQFRQYINAVIKSKGISKEKKALEKLFNQSTAYQFNQIRYIRFIDARGAEKVVSKYGKASDEYRNVSDADFFQQGMTTRFGEISIAKLEKWQGNAYIHRSVPVVVKNKRLGILAITIDAKNMLSRYGYLHSMQAADVIALVNRQGKVMYHFGSAEFDKTQAETVIGVIKQNATHSAVMEYQENIWSYINNKAYGFSIIFLSRGEKITAMLNSEYKKIGLVLFVGGFALVFLVFMSTRMMHQQTMGAERKKVINAQRSHNFASISDEIRRPINTLLGSLTTLCETTLDLKQKNYAITAKKSADYLLALVNEFQDYSKITRGEFKLEKIEFDLRTTVHDIAELMSAEAYKKDLEVSSLVSSDVPERVLGDVTRLRQVLINLVSYTVHHTDNGEVSLCISADNPNQNTQIINIDISDTGGMLDQDRMSQQITMFTDIDIENEENYSSEGLGLALSKQLIELMSGEITMRENSMGGNTFSIRLPLPVVDAVREGSIKANLDGKRILIVGEIETNRNALSQEFARWGMSGAAMEEFDRVTNVLRDAVISNKGFDVCLLDVSLSSSSEKAFELVKEIRMELEVNELAIVTLTAQGVAGDARRAKDLGIQAYLTKPVSRESMHKAILSIFNSSLDQTQDIVTKHSLKEGEHKNVIRILLAEQDSKVSKQLVKHFNQSGILVDLASNGSKAEIAMKNNIYDALFISTTLTGINAFKFVRDFRKDESSFNSQLNGNLLDKIHMPIIAVLNEQDETLAKKCQESGMNESIYRPYDETQLNGLISRYFTEST